MPVEEPIHRLAVPDSGQVLLVQLFGAGVRARAGEGFMLRSASGVWAGFAFDLFDAVGYWLKTDRADQSIHAVFSVVIGQEIIA